MGEEKKITIEFPPETHEALEKRKKKSGVAKSNIIKRATAKELGIIK